MKKMIYVLSIMILTQFTGCILFHSVSYEIKLMMMEQELL